MRGNRPVGYHNRVIRASVGLVCLGALVACDAAGTKTGPAYVEVSAGRLHSCALTDGQRAFCWGLNTNGALGDGSTETRLAPAAVAGNLRFRSISAGFDSPAPAQVDGELLFASVAPGFFHTCGVTVEGQAYCWGYGRFGQLGTSAVGADRSSSPHATSAGNFDLSRFRRAPV
jgi:alpha-tubulin suppressor-like RCC1 family protein